MIKNIKIIATPEALVPGSIISTGTVIGVKPVTGNRIQVSTIGSNGKVFNRSFETGGTVTVIGFA